MLRTPEDPDLFAALVAQVSDYAIIALDPQGVVETWNLGAQRLKGYAADEALGKGFERASTPPRTARPGCPPGCWRPPAARAGSSTPAGGCAATAPGSGATS